MCDQISINYSPQSDPLNIYNEIVNASGTLNGFNYFQTTLFDIGLIYIYFDGFQWVYNNVFNSTPIEGFLNSTNSCPIGTFTNITPKIVSMTIDTNFVELDCECGIEITWFIDDLAGGGVENFVINTTGQQFGFNIYEFERTIGGVSYGFIIGWNPTNFQWEMVAINNETFDIIIVAFAPIYSNCPIIPKWNITETGSRLFDSIETKGVACKTCGIEERIEKQYKSIKLPKPFVEQNRGGISCCCKYLVLAGNGTESWKNDKTSAWIKLSDPSDVFTFKLLKNGIQTIYIPTPKPFINEPNAFFTTIEWSDVLNLDGVGCYQLTIDYEISGIVGSFPIGEFELKPYTIENALKTARVRVIFDGIHETDGINFTGSGVESTFRFFGYIGNRQPNTEIDNIIYQNREMKRVIRENLNTYELITDPENECIIKLLLDLYLLSENQIFISDYNQHNHSYRYLDLPVIVKESPEIDYFDFSRLASLKCIFEDKIKQNRTYYGG